MDDVQHQFSIMGMWNAATPIGKGVIIVLLIMSIWSLTIAVERLWRFHQAKKQSLQVALGVTPLLKQHKLAEAITFAKDKKFRHSHLARVLAAGLTEFQYQSSEQLPPDFDLVDSGKRAIEREALMTTAEMKKGLGNLATPPEPLRAMPWNAPMMPMTVPKRPMSLRRRSGGVDVQLLPQQNRALQRGDVELLLAAHRLLHQERSAREGAGVRGRRWLSVPAAAVPTR